MSVTATPVPLRAAPPPPAPWELARERLIAPLLGTDARVVVVRAPAGYGKTTMLAAWARRDPRPFRWPAPGRGALSAAARAPGTVHVLDGWPPAALDGLATVAKGLAPRSQVVVASRAAVPLSRLRAQRAVLEVGPRELAMTTGEARELLRGTGVPVDPQEVDALMDLTRGWPAMLSLAAQARPAATGELPDADDYVRDVLLTSLPPRIARFLRHCSLLELLDADVCDELLGIRDASVILSELERGELPIAPTGRDGAPLCCHPLLRRTLRAELRRREPAAAGALHLRAAAVFERRGEVDAAIDHAVAAGDVETAGRLLWTEAASYAWDGRSRQLDRWLDALGPRAVTGHATIAMTVAMNAVPRLAVLRADRATAAAARSVGRAPPSTRRSLRAAHLALGALTSCDGARALQDAATQVTALATDDEPARALAGLLGGVAALLAGNADAAVAPLEDGVRRAAVTAPGIAALCEAELALAALIAHDANEGAHRIDRARARVAAHGLTDHALLVLVVAVSALGRAERGHFSEARADVEAATRVLACRDAVPPWYQAHAGVALALALLRLSDVGTAHRRLDEAHRAAARLPDATGLAAWIAAARAALDACTLAAEDPGGVLTPAELRVLRHLPSHLSYREIGDLRHVSTNTIRSQARAVYRKLDVSSRSAAVARAAELGLLEVPERSPSAC